jgi:hypothetical protein
MKLAVLLGVVLVACACGKKPETTGTGNGTGTGTGTAADCEGARGNVEALYRAEAEAEKAAAKDPSKVDVDEMVADNTTMVMNDCAVQPGKVAACAAGAKTVAELEDRCLIPLDEEGTEGEQLLPSRP